MSNLINKLKLGGFMALLPALYVIGETVNAASIAIGGCM